MRLIHAVLSRVDRVLEIRVPFKSFGVYDLVGELTSDYECILQSTKMSEFITGNEMSLEMHPNDVPLTAAFSDQIGS